ncbi:hypothetical protein ACFX2I_027931 [Malus domestica]
MATATLARQIGRAITNSTITGNGWFNPHITWLLLLAPLPNGSHWSISFSKSETQGFHCRRSLTN